VSKDTSSCKINLQFEKPNYKTEKGRLNKMLKSSAKQSEKEVAKNIQLALQKNNLIA
jgi:hypothetical protein